MQIKKCHTNVGENTSEFVSRLRLSFAWFTRRRPRFWGFEQFLSGDFGGVRLGGVEGSGDGLGAAAHDLDSLEGLVAPAGDIGALDLRKGPLTITMIHGV